MIAQIGGEPLHDECDGEENEGVMLNGTVEEGLHSGTPAPRPTSNSGERFRPDANRRLLLGAAWLELTNGQFL